MRAIDANLSQPLDRTGLYSNLTFSIAQSFAHTHTSCSRIMRLGSPPIYRLCLSGGQPLNTTVAIVIRLNRRMNLAQNITHLHYKHVSITICTYSSSAIITCPSPALFTRPIHFCASSNLAFMTLSSPCSLAYSTLFSFGSSRSFLACFFLHFAITLNTPRLVKISHL